jgi:hypothetical protein
VFVIAVIAAPTQASPSASSPTAVTLDQAADAAIDVLMSRIAKMKKPPFAWMVDTAARVYAAYQQYKNGERVAAVEAATLKALQEIAALVEKIEQGKELSAEEYRLARELIDAHERRITDLERHLREVHEVARAAMERTKAAERAAQQALASAEAAKARTAELERETAVSHSRIVTWMTSMESMIQEIRLRFFRVSCGVGRAPRGGRCVDVAENPL